MFDLNRLQSALLTSKLNTTNKPLYQVISQLISTLQELQATISGIGSSGVIPVDISAQDYLTSADDSAALPNSRQLLAGTNITFDDAVANERTINSSGGSSVDYVVASDGGIPTPQPLNDGFGNFIYVAYIP